MSAKAATAKQAVAAKKQAVAAKKSAPPAKRTAAGRGKRQAATPAKRAAKQSQSLGKQTPTKAHAEAVPSAAASPMELAHRLHLLLHSIHQIERYEEQLCSIQDAIRRTGRLSAPLLRDLQGLMDDLPADEFLHDFHAVRSAVQQ